MDRQAGVYTATRLQLGLAEQVDLTLVLVVVCDVVVVEPVEAALLVFEELGLSFGRVVREFSEEVYVFVFLLAVERADHPGVDLKAGRLGSLVYGGGFGLLEAAGLDCGFVGGFDIHWIVLPLVLLFHALDFFQLVLQLLFVDHRRVFGSGDDLGLDSVNVESSGGWRHPGVAERKVGVPDGAGVVQLLEHAFHHLLSLLVFPFRHFLGGPAARKLGERTLPSYFGGSWRARQ